MLPELREHTLDLLVENHPEVRLAHKLAREAFMLRERSFKTTRARPERGAKSSATPAPIANPTRNGPTPASSCFSITTNGSSSKSYRDMLDLTAGSVGVRESSRANAA